MSNVDSGDLNAVPPDAFVRAQQYHAAAISRWLIDVARESGLDSESLDIIYVFLHDTANDMDAGKLRVPEVFR